METPTSPVSGAPVPPDGRAGRNEEGLRPLLAGLTAVRDGDFSVRLAPGADGVLGEIAEVFNGMLDQLNLVTSEVTRVAQEVGGQGRLGGQAQVPGVDGVWRDLTDSVNGMARNLTDQVRNIAQVTTAVAKGDLTQKIEVDALGEILALKNTVNTMVDQLSAFADEVTRVAREVGTDGKLGGQATVPGVAGTWRDLTDKVNVMAGNLTTQVRAIAQVATAVATGDLTQKIEVDARGEVLELKTTINTMVDQLSAFADEVTRVAREVGTEGKLGGQAEVEGVSGTWKRLTENVNELAGNLTRQVRAIAEVTSAVAEGDLTRSITVEAPGEVGDLKDNINDMVESLRQTTRRNQEQDWLKTNLARFTALMQGSRSLTTVAETVLDELTPLVHAQFGAFYLAQDGREGTRLVRVGAYGAPEGQPPSYRIGESLVGQCARSRRTLLVEDLPPGYLTISSGAGSAAPGSLLLLPVVMEDQLLGVIELAALRPFSKIHRDFLDQVTEALGVNVSSLVANARTDELLTESQRLTAELRSQQQELRHSNTELQEQAALLADRNSDIETKNREIELARQELEERAQQLSTASMYKSEFLANMSHELRTPLNSLLVLAQLLAQNPGGNLTDKQVGYATVIHSAGSDLLELINDILDLSKVEAGKLDVSLAPFALRPLLDSVETIFRPLTADKALEFRVSTGPDLPAEIVTDEQRLRQVLRNLLSNAVKFTETGGVELRVELIAPEVRPRELRDREQVLAFRVEDTGIGIAEEHLNTIFGAFQQADGTTSRRYGGTGLGLSISRQIAHLLGGVIEAESTLGRGSRFSLLLPVTSSTSPNPPAAVTAPARSAPTGNETGNAPDNEPGNAPGSELGSELAGRVALVVDDDERNVFALVGVLELHGARVLRAVDGQEGLDLLQAHDDVDVVLMDLMMPELDGYEATRRIRAIPRFARLPIIAVTAKAMPGDREEILAAGATDYVVKPLDADDLLARILRHLAPPGPSARPDQRSGEP